MSQLSSLEWGGWDHCTTLNTPPETGSGRCPEWGSWLLSVLTALVIHSEDLKVQLRHPLVPCRWPAAAEILSIHTFKQKILADNRLLSALLCFDICFIDKRAEQGGAVTSCFLYSQQDLISWFPVKLILCIVHLNQHILQTVCNAVDSKDFTTRCSNWVLFKEVYKRWVQFKGVVSTAK